MKKNIKKKSVSAKGTGVSAKTKKSAPAKGKKSAAARVKKTSAAKVKNPHSGKIIKPKDAAKHPSGKKSPFSHPVLIVAGEHSGDLLASDLIHEFKKRDIVQFYGTGGEKMLHEGVELLERIENMSVMGFVEAFQAYRKLKKLALLLTEEAVKKKTRIAVLVDYPGFNLRLAEMLKAKGIKVIFVVSPQIWAWKYKRIQSIKKNVDLMLVLFSFEKKIYDDEGVLCEWIGHPLLKRIPLQLKKETLIKPHSGITVGLLPGSRKSEVSRHLDPMLDAAELLQEKYNSIHFLIPCADSALREFIEERLSHKKDLRVQILEGNSLRVMEASRLLILSSGTATLEAAYFKKPVIIIYRVSWLNFLIASVFARVRFIGLVNIIARKQIALELLQKEITPQNIAREAVHILSDRKYRDDIISEMEYVVHRLGRGNPAARAVESALSNF